MFDRIVPITKLEKILFYIFLFLIPLQLRGILYWNSNEWNSIFIYLGDVLLIGVLILWVRRLKWEKPDLFKFFKWERSGFLLVLFLIIAGISLFFADNLFIGVFRFIKLLEFGLLFLYVKSNLIADKRRLRSDKSDIRGLTQIKAFQVLIFSGVVQAILAISQFLKQSSLGLKFIEAGVYTPGEPGVATFISHGEKIMRAYGSFPHPNLLAGFLLLGIFCLYALWLSKSEKPLLLITCYLLLVFALFLTFSRTVIGVFLVISLAMFLFFIIRRIERVQIIRLFGLFLVSCILVIAILWPYLQARFFTISFEEEAIDLRFFYNKMAFAMIKEKPFLGIGIGNFVWHSQNYEAFLRAAEKMLEMGGEAPGQSPGQLVPSWIYQPVHNLYLLIAVEMGIIALVIFLGFILIRLIRPITPITFLIISFLILGLSDHYFWALHSGGIIFWLALGLARNNL